MKFEMRSDFSDKRAGVLVPQAEIQGEPAIDSSNRPEQNKPEIVGVGVAAGGAAGDAGAAGRGNAGQQVGQVVEAQPSARELIVVGAHQRAAVIHAGLEGVAASRPDESVHDLIGLADASARLIGRCAQALESAHDDGRQAAFGSGDQADAGRVESGIQRREDLREAVKAHAGVLNQAAGQDLRKVQSANCTRVGTTVW